MTQTYANLFPTMARITRSARCSFLAGMAFISDSFSTKRSSRSKFYVPLHIVGLSCKDDFDVEFFAGQDCSAADMDNGFCNVGKPPWHLLCYCDAANSWNVCQLGGNSGTAGFANQAWAFRSNLRLARFSYSLSKRLPAGRSRRKDEHYLQRTWCNRRVIMLLEIKKIR